LKQIAAGRENQTPGACAGGFSLHQSATNIDAARIGMAFVCRGTNSGANDIALI
jgi:hypothetical protein